MKNQTEIILSNFPWFSMSETHRNTDRNCTACCCAMCVEYLKPGSISDIKQYIDRLYDVGDKTHYTTFSRYWFTTLERKIVNQYGVDYKFNHSITFEDIDARLKNNLPTCIGIKHKGTLDNPTGVHVCVIIGKTLSGDYIVHDPMGDMNLDYSGEELLGKEAVYKKTDLEKRWSFKGNSGWALLFEK